MGCPTRLPHEYVREGTAKLMALFHPASGKVRVKGVPGTPNKVLHAWLQQLEDILNRLPPDSGLPAETGTQRRLPGVVGGTSGDKGHGSGCIGWPHQEHVFFSRCGAHEQLWLNGNGRGERPTSECLALTPCRFA
jgi:hypothetical protein